MRLCWRKKYAAASARIARIVATLSPIATFATQLVRLVRSACSSAAFVAARAISRVASRSEVRSVVLSWLARCSDAASVTFPAASAAAESRCGSSTAMFAAMARESTSTSALPSRPAARRLSRTSCWMASFSEPRMAAFAWPFRSVNAAPPRAISRAVVVSAVPCTSRSAVCTVPCTWGASCWA